MLRGNARVRTGLIAPRQSQSTRSTWKAVVTVMLPFFKTILYSRFNCARVNNMHDKRSLQSQSIGSLFCFPGFSNPGPRLRQRSCPSCVPGRVNGQASWRSPQLTVWLTALALEEKLENVRCNSQSQWMLLRACTFSLSQTGPTCSYGGEQHSSTRPSSDCSWALILCCLISS